MKTKQRILASSLALFNQEGEPNVSTNHIADEVDISPGNLYYHYRNKESILICLYEELEAQLLETIHTVDDRETTLEDMWLFLHLLFENIWHYRFFYRDLHHILSRSDKIKKRYAKLLQQETDVAIHIFRRLVKQGIMSASDQEIYALANNVSLTATYWLNFQTVLNKTNDTDPSKINLSDGVYQIMALVAPYLRDQEKGMLQSLSRVYLNASSLLPTGFK